MIAKGTEVRIHPDYRTQFVRQWQAQWGVVIGHSSEYNKVRFSSEVDGRMESYHFDRELETKENDGS